MLSLCSRCRLSLSSHLPISPVTIQHTQRRFRKTDSRGRKLKKEAALRKQNQSASSWPHINATPVDANTNGPQDATKFFETNAFAWTKFPLVAPRLARFGIPDEHVRPLLTAFQDAATGGRIATPAGIAKYRLHRFSTPYNGPSRHTHLDQLYTSTFYLWAADETNEPHLLQHVPLSTLQTIRTLAASVNLERLAESFFYTRCMPRKIIMHVGPTNSGKTHMALRALAAARVGVYAGPLRLLAHEIWERLNKGQIVPAGIDPSAEDTGEAEPDDRTNFDVLPETKDRVTLRKDGHPKYARTCNLLTGEDQKIVSLSAQLTSATVEMLTSVFRFDVGVIDEIQMIADPERGGAWTSAVLGLCAKELHLCGEETAVPVIEALVQETGDELVVNRYKRLTPLVVEDESLQGRLEKVRPGDCVVVFSRKGIFGVKKRIEELTGLRCAVVYGALPPEVRSEQAALFNDPESGYDVLVASDAIGMGLNLKIKRVVFEAVRKYDGEKERLLSDSQMKQIAGRAGRYGLLSENASGLVTTLHAADLAIVKSALTAPPVPLEHARFQYGLGLMNSLAEALPPGASMDTIDDAVMYVGRFGFVYRPTVLRRLPQMNQFFDQECPGLRLQERFFFMQAPIPWRDLDCLPVVARLLRLYRTRMSADIVETLEPSGLLKRLESAERTMADPADAPESTPKKLCLLESLHRILTLYMWLSYRNPVVWADHEVCMDLKARVEKALDWGLQGVAWSRRKSTSFKPKADNGLRYVSPFEAKKLRELSRRQPQAMYAS